ncbi:MAG: ABC transporter permease [Gemmatimonadota bacterium]|nr:ABC transporter permease [Gemmatimonadota bacterium]
MSDSSRGLGTDSLSVLLRPGGLARAARSVTEGVGIALDAIWANKLRSGLTVLGVVIGVSTVMAMASIVNGIRGQIINTIEVVGPTTIRVVRFFSSTPLNPDALPREVRIRPVLKAEEAEAIAALPEITYSAIWMGVLERLSYGSARTQPTVVYGADDRYMEILGGGMAGGRLFTPSEVRSGAQVVIIEVEAAERVFGQLNPLGKTMRVGSTPFRVVGVYRKPENIFQPPGQEIAAVVPFEAAKRAFRYDETQSLIILVKPVPGVTVNRAMDLITVQMRRLRGLRPGNPNTFDMITSDQVLSLFDRLTGVFFLVMIVLSSVALMVGGIGVMAIMLVSVTERTKEIGVRKAMGATRTEILWQFLVEAATLTLIGGAIGVASGLALGQALKSLLRLESGVPVWSAVIATAVSVAVGLIFGILPANRAAKLDPVEALRYE